MIYADHAATTPLSPNAYAAMQPWLQDKYGNPSTLYSLAREPRKAVARSRETIAAAINADPNEIFINLEKYIASVPLHFIDKVWLFL